MFKRLASLLIVTLVFAMGATVAFGQGTGVTGSITGAGECFGVDHHFAAAVAGQSDRDQ